MITSLLALLALSPSSYPCLGGCYMFISLLALLAYPLHFFSLSCFEGLYMITSLLALLAQSLSLSYIKLSVKAFSQGFQSFSYLDTEGFEGVPAVFHVLHQFLTLRSKNSLVPVSWHVWHKLNNALWPFYHFPLKFLIYG